MDKKTMDLVKKYFPYSFSKKKTRQDLIKAILIYLVAGFVGGLVIGLLGKIPLIGFLFGIVGTVVEIYVVAGIVLTVLDYKKMLK